MMSRYLFTLYILDRSEKYFCSSESRESFVGLSANMKQIDQNSALQISQIVMGGGLLHIMQF